MIAYGPVPSRRLGKSLGINNLPPKVCSYSCIYCQVGRTVKMASDRATFHPPEVIFRAARDRVAQATEAGERVDYLSFVPDGEPTLDVNLGLTMGRLRMLSQRIAVISNSSLISDPEVREDLSGADWVSLKVDAVREQTWRRINRPHRTVRLPALLEGILQFAETYRGRLVTETMLVAGLNDTDEEAAELAGFLRKVSPARAYLAVPTRPPAEKWVRPPSEDVLNRYYQILSRAVAGAEYLIGYEGNAFASTGNVPEDLLSITAVHPMREEAVRAMLSRADADWTAIQHLLDSGRLVPSDYQGHRYYLRSIVAPGH